MSVLHSIDLPQAPQRVVSLVPSMTESLFDLGLGGAVVGITDYCTQPAGRLGGLPRLGGPKNPHVDQILALQPDLVIAGWEENTRQPVEALQAAGVPVWITFPRSVTGTLEVLYEMARLFRSALAQSRVQTLEITVEWAGAALASGQALRYFCPIWRQPAQDAAPWWMTFNAETYCSDILRLAGGVNIFDDRTRRYPLAADLGQTAAEDPAGRDARYPRVTLEEILAGQPQLVLLPDEPYSFSAAEREEVLALLGDTPAGRAGRVHLVDGSLITWPGTRLARALQQLPGLFGLA
ncbi:MAG: helical backbone metal receptor [Chloroflexota bacterium]